MDFFVRCPTSLCNQPSENSALKLPNSIAELRKHVNMLVIDDNDFTPEPYLKANGYQMHHKTDIDTIKDVEPYDIILCDISLESAKNLVMTRAGHSLSERFMPTIQTKE